MHYRCWWLPNISYLQSLCFLPITRLWWKIYQCWQRWPRRVCGRWFCSCSTTSSCPGCQTCTGDEAFRTGLSPLKVNKMHLFVTTVVVVVLYTHYLSKHRILYYVYCVYMYPCDIVIFILSIQFLVHRVRWLMSDSPQSSS